MKHCLVVLVGSTWILIKSMFDRAYGYGTLTILEEIKDQLVAVRNAE